MKNKQTQVQKQEQEKKKSKSWILLLLLLLLLLISVISISITIWALVFRDSTPPLTPDYAPQKVENNATPIPGDDPSKMDAPQGGGAVSLTYAKEVTVDLSEKKAKLLFANPSRSTQDMVLQLVIQNTVVIQSGRLLPGYQVTTLALRERAEELLMPGGYEGSLVVLYYDPESGEKSMINTEIPITVYVTE